MEFERIYKEPEIKKAVADNMGDRQFEEYCIHRTEEKEQMVAYSFFRSRYNIIYANKHYEEILNKGVEEVNIEDLVNTLDMACKKTKICNIKNMLIEENMDLKEEDITNFSLQHIIRGIEVAGETVYSSGIMLSSNLLSENDWYKIKLYNDGLSDNKRMFRMDIIPQKLNYLGLEGYVTVLITDTTKIYERIGY